MQETRLNPTHTNFLKQYAIFRKDLDGADMSSGGVAIIVDRSVACQHLALQMALEAVSIMGILCDELVTVFFIYMPPNYKIDKLVFDNLVDQLPEHFIIVADFNVHNSLWGDARCDAMGRFIENIVLNSGVCLFNKKQPTYYNCSHNSYSSIDLVIGAATLFPHLDWNVITDSFGSDHFPIALSLRKQEECIQPAPRWKMASADWELFKQCTFLSRDFTIELSVDDAVAYFTDLS